MTKQKKGSARIRISGSAVARFGIGKTSVTVFVGGCVRCGTDTSSKWHFDQVATLLAGGKAKDFELQMCEDCSKGG